MGSEAGSQEVAAAVWPHSETKKPRRSGAFFEAAEGIRTLDLLHGKQTL